MTTIGDMLKGTEVARKLGRIQYGDKKSKKEININCEKAKCPIDVTTTASGGCHIIKPGFKWPHKNQWPYINFFPDGKTVLYNLLSRKFMSAVTRNRKEIVVTNVSFKSVKTELESLGFIVNHRMSIGYPKN